MRLSVVLLVFALLGVLGGGWLTGRLGFGLSVIAVSVVVGALALLHDAQAPAQPSAYEAPTLHDVLERARRTG